MVNLKVAASIGKINSVGNNSTVGGCRTYNYIGLLMIEPMLMLQSQLIMPTQVCLFPFVPYSWLSGTKARKLSNVKNTRNIWWYFFKHNIWNCPK